MRKTYLSDNEIDVITNAIYNDTLENYYKSLPQDDLDHNEEVVKELFKEIEYLRIQQAKEYIITKEGRVFNSKTIKYRKPTVSTTTIFFMLSGGIRIDLQQEFENNGWTYDQDEILTNYKRNKWPLILLTASKRYFKSL